MLADQGLGHVEGVDELVHAALRLPQLQHDRDAHRRRQRAQQLTGALQDVGPRDDRRRLVVVDVITP